MFPMCRNVANAFSALLALCTLFFPLAVSADVPADIPKARIAVLGGTFLNDVIFYREGIIKKVFAIEPKAGTSPEIHHAESYPRINPLSLDIVLASLPRVAALQGKPRVSDGLINHPEMTSQKKKDHHESFA